MENCLTEPDKSLRQLEQTLSVVPSGTTLRDADVDLIARMLADCKGNVSEAARKLKVSRGLIYRHMKNQQHLVSR
jgi:transcriptional regulator of acetoin/glycerol metabolism